MRKLSILNSLLIVATVLLSTSCSSPSDNNTQNELKKKDSTPAGTNNNDVKIAELKAAGNIAGKVVDDIATNKRRKDSVRLANATHTWVYQIGEPFEESDLAGNEWNKLNGMSNVYIFKKNRHEFYLIKDDGYPKELLEDSLGDFKRKVQGIETRVAILDLGTLCSGKDKPAISKPIKYKADGDKKTIECHECE